MDNITPAFQKRSILVTGGLGFLGSVVLEQLLRVFGADIAHCYVLVRGRRGQSAKERLDRLLLSSQLFSVVREKHPEALVKAEAIEGDITRPDLGLSEADAQRLSDVSVVIHCAAQINLYDPIHTLLTANYLATRHLLDFSTSRLRHCAAFLHTSSTSVNFDKHPGETVDEHVYPLCMGDMPVDDVRLSSELLSMDPASADVQAGYLVRHWRLRAPYVLTKRLAEQLVERYHQQGLLPCAIVRPSSIVAVAGAPAPGYMGNYAMYASLIVGYAHGFYSPTAFAHGPDDVMDAVPCDVAAGVVLGAAAALAAGVHSRRQLREAAAAASSAPAAATKHDVACEPSGPGGAAAGRGAAGPAGRCGGGRVVSGGGSGCGGGSGDDSNGGGSSGSGEEDGIMVFHAATSTVRPLPMIAFYDRMHRFFSAHRPQHAWLLPTLTARSRVHMSPSYRPDPDQLAAAKRATRNMVSRTGVVLRMMGRGDDAKRLDTSLRAWEIINNRRFGPEPSFSVRNGLLLQQLLRVGAAPWPSSTSMHPGLAPDLTTALASVLDADMGLTMGTQSAGSGDTTAKSAAAAKTSTTAATGGSSSDADDGANGSASTAISTGTSASSLDGLLRGYSSAAALDAAAAPQESRTLLPVVWRGDWGPLLDGMMADVVQRLMRVPLVPPPPPPPLPAS